MPTTNAPWELRKNEVRNGLFHRVTAFPASPKPGQFCYREDLGIAYIWSGVESVWIEADGRTAIPEGPAGGSLTGTYPNPTIAAKAVQTGQIADYAITAQQVATALKDGVTTDPTLRSLGTGPQQAAAGNDSRLSDRRTPIVGSVTDSEVAANAGIQLSKLAVNPLARANHTGTQLAATISDFDQQVRTSRLDQFAVPTTAVLLNGQRITGLADPVGPQDAATKAYVDATAQGLDVKASVRAIATSNITLSGTQTIDGVNLVAGNRVLVVGQSSLSTNGIYVVAAGAWTRATDADSGTKLNPGMFTFVEEGLTNADSGWVLTTDGAVTLGTTNLTFTQFSGAGGVEAGAGLTKSGNRVDVGGTTDRISVTTDNVDIAATYVGQTSITTLGTVATGTWAATVIALAKGGTGASTASQARVNLGAPAIAAFDVPGGNAAAVINHTLNTKDLLVEVYNTTTGMTEYFDVVRTSTTAVTINSADTIPANTYRAILTAVPVA